jgi:hypothetical protein
MAVASNIEWKTQEAILNALAQNLDLPTIGGGVQLRRAYDESNPETPPSVTVFAYQSKHPGAYGGRKAFDEVFVEIRALTKVRADQTGELVELIIGAVRDQVRDDQFINQLNAVVDFTAYGAEETGTSFRKDTKTDRTRRLTVRILANPSDLNN